MMRIDPAALADGDATMVEDLVLAALNDVVEKVNELNASALGGLGGLLVASGVLLFNDSARARLVPWLVSYAVGALLGVSTLAILPSALEQLPASRVLGTLLLGILLFFLLEKLVLWRHCHTHDCEVHDGAVLPVLVGDAFHNFVDGAVVAAAVLTSVPLGISTALARYSAAVTAASAISDERYFKEDPCFRPVPAAAASGR